MSTDGQAVFEVRDSDLPDRPPLAYADDYRAALHTVGWLHRQFHDQLAANSEGATHLSQSLDVVRVGADVPPQLLYFSAVNGSR